MNFAHFGVFPPYVCLQQVKAISVSSSKSHKIDQTGPLLKYQLCVVMLIKLMFLYITKVKIISMSNIIVNSVVVRD